MLNKQVLEYEVKIGCIEIGYEFNESVLDLLIPELEYEKGIDINEAATKKSIEIIKEIVNKWKQNTIENYM